MNNEQRFLITSSPHIHSGYTVNRAMYDVLLALLPTVFASIYFFGSNAFLVIITCIFSAVIGEYLAQKIQKRAITIKDGSAALTGLLLALTLPPAVPLFVAALGSLAAIIIGKQVFGGLGCNVFNPAHIGRAILLTSFPVHMTSWTSPFGIDAVSTATPQKIDAVSTATPLDKIRALEYATNPEAITNITSTLPPLPDLFIGKISGSLGETCVPALLLGGLFLLWRKHIDWKIPFYYIATLFIVMAVYAFLKGYGIFFPFYHVLAGGLIIGAFFMATDWVTSPLTNKGKIIFAVSLGILTALFRLKSSYPEGVCYSILIMNMLTPLIDRYCKRRTFGRSKQ